MKGLTKYFVIFSLAIFILAGCSALSNPFVGNWVSGAFNLEFKSDKTFKLSIGKTISVNLDGNYKYDDEILALEIDGDNEIIFSYQFKDDNKTLVLKPESESNYFNTKIEFTKE